VMTETVGNGTGQAIRRLLFPTEHGAWSWLVVPYVTGVAIGGSLAATAPGAATAVLLVLVAGLSVFLVRQPFAAWLRIRSGRGLKARLPLARNLSLLLLALAGLSLSGLVALGRTQLLLLGAVALGLLLLYLGAARLGRTGMRAATTELLGAVGLSLTALAAVIAVTGTIPPGGWWFYLLWAGYNALGVLYVRLRIGDTRGRKGRRTPVVVWHLAFLAVVVALAAWKAIPLVAILPFIGISLRAGWVARSPRPVERVKRFGFTELGLAFVTGAVITLAYWIGQT